MMTFLMSPLKCTLLPRQEVAETVAHAKNPLFFWWERDKREAIHTPPTKSAGAGRVGRGPMKGGGVLLGRMTAAFLEDESQ